MREFSTCDRSSIFLRLAFGDPFLYFLPLALSWLTSVGFLRRPADRRRFGPGPPHGQASATASGPRRAAPGRADTQPPPPPRLGPAAAPAARAPRRARLGRSEPSGAVVALRTPGRQDCGSRLRERAGAHTRVPRCPSAHQVSNLGKLSRLVACCLRAARVVCSGSRLS